MAKAKTTRKSKTSKKSKNTRKYSHSCLGLVKAAQEKHDLFLEHHPDEADEHEEICNFFDELIKALEDAGAK